VGVWYMVVADDGAVELAVDCCCGVVVVVDVAAIW
jgi:hypothetical protein